MARPPKWRKKCTDLKCMKRTVAGKCSVLELAPVGKCWARTEDPAWREKLEMDMADYSWRKNGERIGIVA